MTPIEASHATCVWRHGAHRCFKKGLAAGWTALTLLSVLSGDRIVALAQQPAENSHVGKRVITQFGTVLKVGNQVVDDEGRGKALARGKNQRVFRTYTVEQVNGHWLWLVAEGPSVKAGHRPLTSSLSIGPSTTSRARSTRTRAIRLNISGEPMSGWSKKSLTSPSLTLTRPSGSMKPFGSILGMHALITPVALSGATRRIQSLPENPNRSTHS